MSKVKRFLDKYKVSIILWFMILLYIGYFSFFTVMRYRNLYASYFDLGIMHQTVYNSYMSLKTGDWSRFLELTNPHGVDQVKRMAIHNDIILGLLTPFYFIHPGPETLLIIQSVVLGLGGLAVFLITQNVFKDIKQRQILGLIFTFSYLMYPTLERSNIFEFHGVVLATSFLLFMFYFWLAGRFRLSLLFLLLSICTKEQVALTTLFFGIFVLYKSLRLNYVIPMKIRIQKQVDSCFRRNDKCFAYSLLIICISIVWFVLSIAVIIPQFRGSRHFALEYYTDLKNALSYILHIDTLHYFIFLLGPVGFLSLLSPLYLLLATPEFAINLLSNSWNMRNIVFHYTAVITPFIFISSIYGAHFLFIKKIKPLIVGGLLLSVVIVFSVLKSPLPYSKEADLFPLMNVSPVKDEVTNWSNILKDEGYKIMATDHYAPLFASRRYFYVFTSAYAGVDYVIVSVDEALYGWRFNITGPAYKKLQKDKAYKKIYKNGDLEVYKKI